MYLYHITTHTQERILRKTAKRQYSKALKTHVYTEICTSNELCTQCTNTSTWTKQKRQQLGPTELKMHCTCKSRDHKKR